MVESWKKVSIGECCDILDHKRIPLNGEERDKIPGHIPYYGANGVQGFISKYIFDENLIAMAEDGGYFDEFANRPIAYRISGKSWVNNHAHILRAKKGYCQDFIFYSVVHKNIFKFIKGGTRSKLNQAELRSIEISIPDSIDEQSKIVGILTKVDETIDQTEKIIDKQERIKTGLMQDLFTKGIDKNGKIRSEETHKFRDLPIGRILEDWDVQSINKKLYMKGRIGWQGLKAAEFLQTGNYLVTGIHFTDDYKVNWDICYRISDFRYEQAPEIQLKVDDVIITKDGTIGKLAYIDYLPGKTSLNSHLLVLRPLRDDILPRYLFYQLMSERFKRFIEDVKIGTTRPALTEANFGKFYLQIPSIKEQIKIIRILDLEFNKIFDTKSQLIKLKRIKAGLMQDLLTGKVRVTHLLEQEVAI